MVAAWAEYWALIARGGLPDSEVPPDVHADALREAAADDDPARLPRDRGGLRRPRAATTRFREAFLAARSALAAEGVSATLAEALGREGAAGLAAYWSVGARSPRLKTSGGGFCDDSSLR